MGDIKKKRKSIREYQLSSNSRAARKGCKQDVVHRMVMTSLERKKRDDVYGDVKESLMMPFLLAYGQQRKA